jgi:hypothetical protein
MNMALQFIELLTDYSNIGPYYRHVIKFVRRQS